MNQRTLRIPDKLKHTGEQSDAGLQDAAREHRERHPGLLFLADVLRALHEAPGPLRGPAAFFEAFPPHELMEAFTERPDLRVRTLKAITGGPTTLLRRLSTAEVASQIDLLSVEDLPPSERSVRAEADRALSVHELYLKYVDPVDVATYVPARIVWEYEAHEATPGGRVLLASELRSIRRHAIMTDSEILDVLGDETFERHMPLAVRTALRTAARRAAAEGKPFSDADLFAGVKGEMGRDLVDEMVEHIPLASLREVVDQVARMLGLSGHEAVTGPTRVGPKPAAASVSLPAASAAPKPAAAAKHRPPALPPPRSAPASKMESLAAALEATEQEAPPMPEDELAFVEDITVGG